MIVRVPLYFFPLLMIYAWFGVLTLRLTPLGGTWESLDTTTWIIILIWIFIYFTGLVFGILKITKQNNLDWISSYNFLMLKPWIFRLCFIAILGALLIIYEFAFVRGYGFFRSVASIRLMEVNASKEGFGGSWISGIGRMMTPALMTAWVVAIILWGELAKGTKRFLFFASFTVFAQQLMYEGGRFYYAALLTMIVITLKFTNNANTQRKSKFAKKKFLYSVITIVVLFSFGYVFVNRVQASGRNFYEAYSTWAEVFDLELNDDTLRSRLSGKRSGLWFGAIMLWAYITQGINELNVLLLSNADVKAHGLFQFSQIGQIMSKLSGTDLKFNRFENLPHTGTYITLYGASYVDFGHIGAMLFVGFLGWLTGKSIKQLREGKNYGLALNAPLLITLGLFAPVVSLVSNLWPAFVWTIFIQIFRFRLFPAPATHNLVKKA